jgi:hypothetical protein
MVDLIDGPVDPESALGRIFPEDHTLLIIDDRQNDCRAKVA